MRVTFDATRTAHGDHFPTMIESNTETKDLWAYLKQFSLDGKKK